MMKSTLILLFLTISTIASAQILSLDQIISLRSKSVAVLEETLTNKKWTLLEVNDPTDAQRGTIEFAFQKNSFDDAARQFLTIYFQESSPNRLSLQVNRSADYTMYLTRLKQLGFKLTSSDVADGAIVKVYKNKLLVIRIHTQTTKDEYSSATKTYHTLSLFNRTDYELNF